MVPHKARPTAFTIVGLAVLLSIAAFAGKANAGASRASMAAAQSAVRDARDQVQRRQWAQYQSRRHRAYHW
jgi:hypothetical protein